jgi:predicted nicotinamide N-methyase
VRVLTPAQRRAFIVEHTTVSSPPIVPEIRLHLATEVTPLWEATEVTLARVGMPPPFWAFCWPGGQVLARYVLEHPELFAGRRVLDFAAGGGIASIAAARVGAASVCATEIDPFAMEAMGLNATLNGVRFDTSDRDVVETDDGWDVVFAGDVCYERPAAERITRWLRRLAGRGALVLMGDPGRTYMPREGLAEQARYVVPTSRELEEHESRLTTVWRFLPEQTGVISAS